MMSSQAKTIAPVEGRNRKINEAIKMLDAGVERILDGEEFKRYLEFAARFHSYSANNCMLILTQKPEATRVAGYGKWKTLGRQVRRDERGLCILAPVLRTQEDEDTGEKVQVICAFKAVKVFDVSQTDPTPGAKPLPSKPCPNALTESSETAVTLLAALKQLCRDQGVEVREDDGELNALYPTANALYSPIKRLILLRETSSGNQKAKSLTHELVHHLMHRDAMVIGKERPLMEAEAEGAAYAILSYFDLDTSEYSFAYVAHWSEDKEIVKAALSRTQGVVRTLIEAVETGYPKDQAKPTRPVA